MDKETSSRVSSIAGRMLNLLKKEGRQGLRDLISNPNFTFDKFYDDLEALAGSALSQDQTPGQEPPPQYIIEKIPEKLPGFPPAFQLCIMLNANAHFATSFGSLADLANPVTWRQGCNMLHESLIKWLNKEAEKNDGKD